MFFVPVVKLVAVELFLEHPIEKRINDNKSSFLIKTVVFNKSLPSLRKNQQKSAQKIINIELNTIFSMIQLPLQD
jgi:hypothetical protein